MAPRIGKPHGASSRLPGLLRCACVLVLALGFAAPLRAQSGIGALPPAPGEQADDLIGSLPVIWGGGPGFFAQPWFFGSSTYDASTVLVGPWLEIKSVVTDAWGTGFAFAMPLGTSGKVVVVFFGDVTLRIDRAGLLKSSVLSTVILSDKYAGGYAMPLWKDYQGGPIAIESAGGLPFPIRRLADEDSGPRSYFGYALMSAEGELSKLSMGATPTQISIRQN